MSFEGMNRSEAASIRLEEEAYSQTETVAMNASSLVDATSIDFFHSIIWKTLLTIGIDIVKVVCLIFILAKLSVDIPLTSFMGSLLCIVMLVRMIQYRKELLFEVSLLDTFRTATDWWNRVDDLVVLGGIPLNFHFDALVKKEKIGAVLTLLEPFELAKGLVSPVTTDQWTKAKINHKHLVAQDFLALPQPLIQEGVAFLRKNVELGKRTYIHCKAGRGRSAAIVLAYGLTYGFGGKTFSNYDEVYAYLKGIRPRVNLRTHQRAAVEQWFK